MAVVLALIAALLFAFGAVWQHRGAQTAPDAELMRVGLLARLIRNRDWLIGSGTNVGGYGFQAAALAFGTLVVVQPLLTIGLVFALPLGAALTHRRLRRRDWTAAVVLVAGVAAFFAIGKPGGGIDRASFTTWLWCGAAIVVICGGCVAFAFATRGAPRAIALMLAAGVLYGATAGLTKSVMSVLTHQDLWSVFGCWETYALCIVAALGVLCHQSSYQAGSLQDSYPTLNIAEPLASVVIGIAVLEEGLQLSGWRAPALAVAVLAMALGVIVLARDSEESDTASA